jgi:hypothetical protein
MHAGLWFQQNAQLAFISAFGTAMELAIWVLETIQHAALLPMKAAPTSTSMPWLVGRQLPQ